MSHSDQPPHDVQDDELGRAVRALRREGDAPAPQARLTRERILAELRPARRARRWVWAIPIAALLAGSTVLAATGRMPEVLSSVARAFGLTAPESEAARTDEHTAKTRVTAPPSPNTPPEQVAPSVKQEDAPGPQAPSAEAPSTVPPRTQKPPASAIARPVASTEAPSEKPAPTPSAQPAPESPDALALYRAAHRLHFVDQNPAAALVAWDAYLASDPGGPLAVDARYDRALCLLRLGRSDDARRALRPFAEGTYGAYRQSDAKALLDALDAH